MLGVTGARTVSSTTWRPCSDLASHPAESAFADHVDCLEQRLYFSLNGLAVEATELAGRARAAGHWSTAIRAELIAIDVRNRCGDAAAAKQELLVLLHTVRPNSVLACRIRMRLSTACDRLGERTESGRWIREALAQWPEGEALGWRAEALMISALNGVSRTNVDYTLVDHAVSEILAHCDLPLVSSTLANFAEVAAECGDLANAASFADAASALVRRHPEISVPLTLDSIARARLALGELSTAHRCLEIALELEETLHCTDVNGDPWLTFAEVKLAVGQPDEAWALLEHPRRRSWAAKSSWMRSRDLKLRAEILAEQGRWQQAYLMILEHLEIYEGLRSVEGDRALAEFATVQLADEERRRAAEFEKLALTDPLTGLPNRRNVERWLEEAREQAEGAVGVAGQVSIAIIDLDHFKRINDTFSHESGDEVLRRVAVVLAESCLESDRLVARLGGEEFVQLGLGLTRAEALGGASRLLERLRCLCLDEIDPGLRITASIGVALGPAADPASLLKAADRCLYQAKRAGRNRIVLAAG